MPVRATETMGRSCARRRAYWTFATFAVLVTYQPAEGQESSQLPTLERLQPGVSEGIPTMCCRQVTPQASMSFRHP
jgi:hypothetical protein